MNVPVRSLDRNNTNFICQVCYIDIESFFIDHFVDVCQSVISISTISYNIVRISLQFDKDGQVSYKKMTQIFFSIVALFQFSYLKLCFDHGSIARLQNVNCELSFNTTMIVQCTRVNNAFVRKSVIFFSKHEKHEF